LAEVPAAGPGVVAILGLLQVKVKSGAVKATISIESVICVGHTSASRSVLIIPVDVNVDVGKLSNAIAFATISIPISYLLAVLLLPVG
jgi:hypothetical protein